MSTTLLHRPTSFRRRFADGRLGFGDVAAVVLAGTAFCALALLILDGLLVSAPAASVAPTLSKASADAFTERDLGAYVGTWVSDKGAHLIVAKSGAVWADAGGLIGTARLDGRDSSRFLLEGAAFRCSYRVAAERPDAMVWNVVDGTPGTACPEGRYSRRFTF